MIDPREAAQNLRDHQQQLDEDGVMVGVSREALDIVLRTLAVPSPAGEVQLKQELSKLYDEFNTGQIDAATFGYRVFDAMSNAAVAAASSPSSPPDGETPPF